MVTLKVKNYNSGTNSSQFEEKPIDALQKEIQEIVSNFKQDKERSRLSGTLSPSLPERYSTIRKAAEERLSQLRPEIGTPLSTQEQLEINILKSALGKLLKECNIS